jgi:uncharacterized protein involved in exopolysaccharide biosynthesis
LAHSDPGPTPSRVYLENQLAETRHELDNLFGGSATSAIPASLVDRQRELEGQLDQVNLIEIARPVPQLVVPAYADPSGVTPRLGATAAAGGVAGALVALALCGIAIRRRLAR